ncbi:MAG: hypothetical protein WKG07_13570 [Hymenobacter sp.]
MGQAADFFQPAVRSLVGATCRAVRSSDERTAGWKSRQPRPNGAPDERTAG